jgi:hypothetical protein
VWIEEPTGLGHDVDRVALLALELGDQALAAAGAVNVGGVEKVDSLLDRGAERSSRLLVVNPTPGSTDRPGPETNR